MPFNSAPFNAAPFNGVGGLSPTPTPTPTATGGYFGGGYFAGDLAIAPTPTPTPGLGIPFGGSLPTGTVGIPLGGGLPGSSSTTAVLYPDTVVINGVTWAAAVSKGTKTGPNAHWRQFNNLEEGTSIFIVTTADDPLVDYPDVPIVWTANSVETFRSPVLLKSIGGSEPPGAGATQWTISCERVT